MLAQGGVSRAFVVPSGRWDRRARTRCFIYLPLDTRSVRHAPACGQYVVFRPGNRARPGWQRQHGGGSCRGGARTAYIRCADARGADGGRPWRQRVAAPRRAARVRHSGAGRARRRSDPRSGLVETSADHHPRQWAAGGAAGPHGRCLRRRGAVSARCPRRRDGGADRLRARDAARQLHRPPGHSHRDHAGGRRRARPGVRVALEVHRAGLHGGPSTRGRRRARLDGQARRRQLAPGGALTATAPDRPARRHRAARRCGLPRRLRRRRRRARAGGRHRPPSRASRR